jgi:hypothetical protein
MNFNLFIGVLGAWVAAIGTILSAIASTPNDDGEQVGNQDNKTKLNVIGNALQAIGNILGSIVEEQPITRLGEQVQAAGNLTVIYGIVSDNDEKTKTKLEISGNSMQLFGGILEIVAVFGESFSEEFLNIVGNALQSIGNGLQVVGGEFELTGDDDTSQALGFWGSWIQAGGSVISAIDASIPNGETTKDNSENQDK